MSNTISRFCNECSFYNINRFYRNDIEGCVCRMQKSINGKPTFCPRNDIVYSKKDIFSIDKYEVVHVKYMDKYEIWLCDFIYKSVE